MKAFSTSRCRLSLATMIFVATWLASSTAPLQADWLVTVDGSRIATRGDWKVKGRQVVFTARNGTYSALPLSQVDLELSQRLTEAAKAPKEEKAEPAVKKPPVLVLTDKDIPRYRATNKEPTAGAEADQPVSAAPATDLRVARWEISGDTSSASGTTLSGSLVNQTPDAAASIRLIVRVYDEDGQQVGQRYAELDRTALPPGKETSFSVSFPDVLRVGSVKFETRSARFRAAEPEVDSSS